MRVPVSKRGKSHGSSSLGRPSKGVGGKGSSSDVKLGRELSRDTNFYSPLIWVIGPDWTLGFGKATGVPAAESSVTQPNELLVPGDNYQVTIEMTASAGTVKVQFTSGTQVDGPPVSSNSTFVMTAAAGNGNIAIRKSIDFDGEITFLSVRKILS